MSPVLLTSIAPIHTSLVDEGAPGSSSDSSSPMINTSPTSYLSAAITDISPPLPTLPRNLKRQDFYYKTLSVTLAYTTYTTTILLGDSFSTGNLQPTTYAVPSTTSSNTTVQIPGMTTGAIVGIVVGLVVGFLALFAVAYVYFLRARQAKSRRLRRRSRRSSSATADGAPPPPPPPGGPPAPGP